MKVRIPTPLRSYTGQAAVVEVDATDLWDVFAELDRRYPGLRFRVVDEQDRIRKHMRVFVNQESVRELRLPLASSDEVTIMQALSGG